MLFPIDVLRAQIPEEMRRNGRRCGHGRAVEGEAVFAEIDRVKGFAPRDGAGSPDFDDLDLRLLDCDQKDVFLRVAELGVEFIDGSVAAT